MSNQKSRSTVRPKTIEFIKSELESDFVFRHEGDADEVSLFIKAMRTELSRLRNRVRDKGKVPKHFKMRTILVEPVKDVEGLYEITLRKTVSPHNVTNDIDDILGDLAGGSVIDG